VDREGQTGSPVRNPATQPQPPYDFVVSYFPGSGFDDLRIS